MLEDNQRTLAGIARLNQLNQLCEAQAAEQKLSGAGKESFMGKCNADKTRREILMGIAKEIH